MKMVLVVVAGAVVLFMSFAAPCGGVDSRAVARATEVEVPRARLELQAAQGMMTMQGVPFSGVATRLHPNGVPAERVTYRLGKKHGQASMWFEDGTASFRSELVAGRRDGLTRTWWRNGSPRTRSFFVDGKPHGLQTQWYVSGAKFKEMRLVHGQAQGLQQSWRENGKLYNNYEVHDGRIYGLKRSKLCFRLDDEVVQTQMGSREPAGAAG
ncbi:MAG: toxin-antitoxin system YwqK family antitoxin [Myxococcota bacterium]